MSTYNNALPVVASEYRVTASDATHLMIECQIDTKLAVKSMLGCMLLPGILIIAYIGVIFGVLSTSFGSLSFSPLAIVLPVFIGIFFPIMLCVVYAMYKKMARTATIELDKFSNLFTISTPNTFVRMKTGGYGGYGWPTGAGGYGRYNRYAMFGQYFSRMWDLSACSFRLVHPGEPAGPGFGMMRLSLRGMALVMLQPQPNMVPIILLATPRVERAQDMIDDMTAFVRGVPAVVPEQVQPLGTPVQGQHVHPDGNKICPHCGAWNSSSTRFCANCGTEVQP